MFFIRSIVFNELKGFDDEFFAHQEEIDLCWRALNKGYKIKIHFRISSVSCSGATCTGKQKKNIFEFQKLLLMLTKTS
jgi:GT2 family glycosyltransferase